MGASSESLANVLANMNWERPGAGIAAFYIAEELVACGCPASTINETRHRLQDARDALKGTSLQVRFQIDSALVHTRMFLRARNNLTPSGQMLELPEDQPRWNRLGFDDAVECPQDADWH